MDERIPQMTVQDDGKHREMEKQMGIFEIICGILLIFLAIVVVAVVCMQEGKGGLGVLDGSSGETTERFGRNHAKTMTEMLRRTTTVAGGAMIILTLAVAVINARM